MKEEKPDGAIQDAGIVEPFIHTISEGRGLNHNAR